MFILDTNVLSEIMDPSGATQVIAWTDAIPQSDLFTTAVNQAEILYGLAIMPKGRKRNDRVAWADAIFARDFGGRVLPFDGHAAVHYADILAARERSGRRIEVVDAQIAGVARAHAMAIVTRNVGDFVGCGIEVIDPWNA
jgi:predicted nucleic acid-binding protein